MKRIMPETFELHAYFQNRNSFIYFLQVLADGIARCLLPFVQANSFPIPYFTRAAITGGMAEQRPSRPKETLGTIV